MCSMWLNIIVAMMSITIIGAMVRNGFECSARLEQIGCWVTAGIIAIAFAIFELKVLAGDSSRVLLRKERKER